MKIVNIEKVKYSTTGRYISSFPPHLLDIFKFCVCNISIQRSNLKFHAQFWLCWIDTHDIERCTTKFDFLTRSEFLSSTGQSVYGKKNMKLAQAAVRKTSLLVGLSIQNYHLLRHKLCPHH